jgi:hypothetical protein
VSTVKIKVDFYNKKQRELIEKNFPQDFEVIKKFEGKFVDLPIEDFKTYAFFKHQSSENLSFQSLSRFAQNWGHYDLYYNLTEEGKLLNVYPDDKIDSSDVSEMIGVAGGLSVASAIYGLTQADWTKIPITNKSKSFDFNRESAIEGRVINVEAKGSIVPNNSEKHENVLQHKFKIIEKKKDDGFRSKQTTRDSNIGIITVADRNNFLQAWLVDPVVDDFEIAPRKLKLLKRLYFYYSILKFISKRAYVTITLANRIRTIELTDDYEKLDNLPLLNYDFEKLQVSESFINTHSSDTKKRTVGNVVIVDNEVFFIGLEISVINIIVNQNFSDI